MNVFCLTTPLSSHFFTAWRKAIRQIYKLPYRTHSILINHIIQCYPIDIILEKNMYKVYMGINE